MADDSIIIIKNLGKQYELDRQPQYDSFRSALAGALTAPWRRLRNKLTLSSAKPRSLWALQAINLTIRPGETIGLIGPNGAGKSTLLKILCRVTTPTTGEIVLHGRVAALLELGIGFHPDLTGRENIFLNAALLGMPRTLRQARYDAIVNFSGIADFLDIPVKKYSTGMYVRLAFAIATHLDAEILLMDEILAVGDTAYQQQCWQRLTASAQAGCTILLVSHNPEVIRRLCTRTIVLTQGRVLFDGPTPDALDLYHKILRDSQQPTGTQN